MTWLKPKLGQLTRQDATTHLTSEWMAKVDDLARGLGNLTGPAFDKMADAIAKQNATALDALGLDVRGQLGPHLAEMREWNQRLMVQAGREYASGVAEVLDDPSSWGLEIDALTARIQERADVSESRAELIARDQTAKTSGSISKFRQRNAGVTSYTWSGSLDERERETHLANEGKEFDWNDPPAETGHPTEDVQCRCVAVPVMRDEEPEAEEVAPVEAERLKNPARAEAGRRGAQATLERNQEIHGYVKNNLPPELHPLWEREGRSFMQKMGSHAGMDPVDVKSLKKKGATRYRQAVAERASGAFLEHAQLGMEGGGDFAGEVFGVSEAKGEEAIAKHERDLAEQYEAEAKARGDMDESGQLTAQGRERVAREQADREALDADAETAESQSESSGLFDDLLSESEAGLDDVPF